jgi:formiminoglutamase
MTLPLLISVPHAGLRVPDEVRDCCILTPRQIAEDGDEGAAAIYDLAGEVGGFVTTDVARAIVDMNRAEDDRRADGVVKTHTCLDVPVYESFPRETVILDLIETYHRPYHETLSRLAATGVRVGIDCHTMLAEGSPMGPLPGAERPKICLSNVDGTSCPNEWLEAMASSLGAAFGVEVARNFPFKGGFITRSHATELPWMQLELSRDAFLSPAEKRERVIRAFRMFSRQVVEE